MSLHRQCAAPPPEGGALVGEATAAVTPWPHQVRAFEKLYGRWPSKLLIADEVGLGKTIQAGMLLRQAWLSGRAKRILIMAPKAVLGQWQIELREKFNLNWPIYDGRRLVRFPSPALRGQHEREVARSEWHREPVVITSSHLMRRRDRADALLDEAEPWDLVVLDEAHHARRRGAGGQKEGGPNALLSLMRALKDRTQGLVLLTATPMQVHTRRGVGSARPAGPAPRVDRTGVPQILRRREPPESVRRRDGADGTAVPGHGARPWTHAGGDRATHDEALEAAGAEGHPGTSRSVEHPAPAAGERGAAGRRRPHASVHAAPALGLAAHTASCCDATQRRECSIPRSQTGRSRTTSST